MNEGNTLATGMRNRVFLADVELLHAKGVQLDLDLIFAIER